MEGGTEGGYREGGYREVGSKGGMGEAGGMHGGREIRQDDGMCNSTVYAVEDDECVVTGGWQQAPQHM